MRRATVGWCSDVRYGSKAEVKILHFDVCFTLESGHSAASLKCLLWAISGHSVLLTKAHSRSRKRLIGRLLNTTERNCTYDRDGDCPNACKDEGSHDQPSLCLRDGSIRISRKRLYSHCPIAEGPPTVPY
jgi:hypothetical protein